MNMRWIGTTLRILLCVGCLGLGDASAYDCPTAKTAVDGFVAQRGEHTETEVLQIGDTEVQQITRFDGKAVLDVMSFQGLFELERLDRGRRTKLRPIHDLGKIFPPIPGKSYAGLFEIGEGDRKVVRTILLDVKKAETMAIGGCKFKVLRIEQKVAEGEAKPRLREAQYYAPDLKLIIAKEFPERDGSMTTIKYDRIYLKPR